MKPVLAIISNMDGTELSSVKGDVYSFAFWNSLKVRVCRRLHGENTRVAVTVKVRS